MTRKLAKHDLRSVTIVVILITLSLGCLCLPTVITPTIAPTPIPPVVVTEPPIPTEPAVVTPPTTSGALNDEGPWLLMETNQGLWAANSDGSGLTQMTEEDYWEHDLQRAVQPHGNSVVFLSPANYDLHHMTLNLLSLPDGTITKITDLTSPETEAYAELTPGDYGLEALRAVREQINYAWSPDGTRLAFVGLMDRPSAEIYLYDVDSGDITRVSNDDAQNYSPSWSPDGNSLLYFGAASFGVGAGFDTTGVWSARGDGTNVAKLYTPDQYIEEVLVGWLDNTTAVLNTWHPAAGGARLLDIITTDQVVLSEDYIYGVAVDHWFGGAAMFVDPSGLYLLTDEDRTPVLVSEEAVSRIGLVAYDFKVYFTNGSLATYGTSEMEHQVSPIVADSGSLDVATYALIWGWTSEGNSQPGVWITGPGIEIGQIFEFNARLPTWDEYNNLLFFAPFADSGGYEIYRTTFVAYYQDVEVVGFIDAEVYGTAWLGSQ